MGYAAGEFDDFLAAADLAERVGEHLAVLGGDDGGQLLLAGVEQLAEREEDRGALGDRGVAPGGEGRAGGLDDGARVGDVGQRDLAGHLAGGGVGDGGGPVAAAGEVLATGPVTDGADASVGRCESHASILAAGEPPRAADSMYEFAR